MSQAKSNKRIATARSSASPPPLTLAIFYSTGDLGDVGRHAVAAALEWPPSRITRVLVLAKDTSTLTEPNWKCGCPPVASSGSTATAAAGTKRQRAQPPPQHVVPRPEDEPRLERIDLDCTRDALTNHLQGVDAVISCLGNRQPFHEDLVAKSGTERILQALMGDGRNSSTPKRFILLSSVGIADDWPPLEWSGGSNNEEGGRLQGFFRTVCWRQYQDLSGAELAVRKMQQQQNEDVADTAPATTTSTFSFAPLIVRPVMLNESTVPSRQWYIQKQKHQDHPSEYLAKMDCARFLVQEAIEPSMSQRAVVLGGVPATER